MLRQQHLPTVVLLAAQGLLKAAIQGLMQQHTSQSQMSASRCLIWRRNLRHAASRHRGKLMGVDQLQLQLPLWRQKVMRRSQLPSWNVALPAIQQGMLALSCMKQSTIRQATWTALLKMSVVEGSKRQLETRREWQQ
jgi:hypothetical protein